MIKLALGLVMMSILLVSCSDDDNKVTSKNYFKVGDKEYDLSAGIIDNYGTDDGYGGYDGYNTDLALYSNGFSLQKDEYNEWDLVGKGHFIFFELFSSTGEKFDDGDYNFSEAEPNPIGTFNYADYSISLDSEKEYSEAEEGEIWIDIVGGKVNIAKNGDVYTITIDCINDKGEKVSGFYRGKLRYFDWAAGYENAQSAGLKSGKEKRKLMK
ncbi:hypothetical protein SAMN06265379_103280 [Saccharicrinis carchari]|uniref:Lipoprotein n=1 Tax=Saccharicrinis carchari TaxID=1168039 RepID=A0A521CM01_SACCC|nr:hypothetical protein [Saccharicrinis carchari]SMO60454.1 hypothetical protein SAMN06265379_103280 [Saccharicrinis carchari]